MIMTLTAGPTSSPQPLAEVDIELFTFVERYATTLIRWDLLLFFGKHPRRAIAPAELARELHRSLKATTKELDDLTYMRILTRRYTPDKVTYQLVRKGPTRRTVMRLAAYARNRSRTPSR
jgi:DNA-binding MarR family transcriptional regulator